MNIGQVTYEAYVKEAGGVSLISGAKLPPWNMLNPKIQKSWHAAASAAIDYAINKVEEKFSDLTG